MNRPFCQPKSSSQQQQQQQQQGLLGLN